MVCNEERPKRLGRKRHVGVINVALVTVSLFALLLVMSQLPDPHSKFTLACSVVWLVAGVKLKDD